MYASLAIAGTQAIGTFNEGRIAEIQYRMKARAAKQAGRNAKTAAKADSLRHLQEFNDMAASQMAIFSAQGRTPGSGTVQNITRADEAAFNWDADYMSSAVEMQSIATESQVQDYLAAGSIAKSNARNAGLLQAAQAVYTSKQIR